MFAKRAMLMFVVIGVALAAGISPRMEDTVRALPMSDAPLAGATLPYAGRLSLASGCFAI